MQRTIPGPVGRRHREQLLGEIVREYYGWLNNHPPFRQALRELFEAADPLPPRGGSRRTLRAHTVRQFVERWNLPRRYGARDLASSFAQWVLAATLRPRLLHGARYPGLPEHEGKAAATDAHAMCLGYLGRVPPVFLDDKHPAAAVIAARLADRTIHRASWAQIARSADTRGSVDTVRKQVRRWAGELEIALPTIPPGRPRAKDALDPA